MSLGNLKWDQVGSRNNEQRISYTRIKENTHVIMKNINDARINNIKNN